MGGHRPGDEGGGGTHPALGEKLPQFFQGAGYAHLGGVFTRAQRGADLLEIPALEKAQHHGVVVFAAQVFHRAVEQRGDLPPGFGVGLIRRGLHKGLLFAALPPPLDRPGVGAGVARGAAEPAGQNRFRPQRRRLARQNDEHRLRDILGQVRILHLPQSDRIHQIDVTPHQRGERGLGLTPRVFMQQPQIVIRHFRHIIYTPAEK